MKYKSNTLATRTHEQMAGATSPIQIGSKGTVGSLIMREIDYFSRLTDELPHHQVASAPRSSDPGSSTMAAKRRKKGGSKLIPKMCSMVDVANGKNYMNLKADVKKLQA